VHHFHRCVACFVNVSDPKNAQNIVSTTRSFVGLLDHAIQCFKHEQVLMEIEPIF